MVHRRDLLQDPAAASRPRPPEAAVAAPAAAHGLLEVGLQLLQLVEGPAVEAQQLGAHLLDLGVDPARQHPEVGRLEPDEHALLVVVAAAAAAVVLAAGQARGVLPPWPTSDRRPLFRRLGPGPGRNLGQVDPADTFTIATVGPVVAG